MAFKPIGIDELDNFQFDGKGRLHWKGEAVVLEKRLKLEAYQVWLATLATIGALLSVVHPFLVSWHIFGF
ncbi:hypothetical protein P6U16_01275 [Rhizobium sp. 32-5/1]|uniref:hypothetical protein n=1 Tax=Rhizobium sp. 32-5/1 TaxID=3019602 RepID=UPI00240D5CFB|nr:hypothetical protein [Rhizobium sp. 32-5/1]WEZ83517.1 hypothetical protein P6U16_01275 [Rhizobium sp. 32-5/1]